jgi:protein TonB
VQLLAEIEKRIRGENARPKKRYISPATQEEATRSTTTRCAARSRTRHAQLPETAAGKLYGELTM